MPASYSKNLARQVHLRLTDKDGTQPPLDVLEQLFEVSYITSLKCEEGEPVSCRIAFVDRANPDPSPPPRIKDQRWRHFPLEQDLPLNVRNLVKLSKAVDPWSSTLAVDLDAKGGLRIWGLIDQSIHHSRYVAKESKTGPQTPGIFQAVIEGVAEIAVFRRTTFLGRLRQDTLVTAEMGVLQLGPIHDKVLPAIRRLQMRIRSDVGDTQYDRRGHSDDTFEDAWVSVLSRILIGIQRYGHGGAVLISDKGEGLSARYSLKYPRLSDALFNYGASKVRASDYRDKIYNEYLKKESMPVELYLGNTVLNFDLSDIEDEIRGCVHFISSLSRVDGLVWMSHDLSLKGFGAVIATEEDPDEVFWARNVTGTKTARVDIHNLGTRHRSMIRQCWRDRESVGFVVSQDGDVRAIARIGEKILMWENIRLQSFVNARSLSEQ
jgi:hypothetical protein